MTLTTTGALDALLPAVRRGLPTADPIELLARAAWTVAAEPADGVAGSLVAALGAADALAVVRGGATGVPGKRHSRRLAATLDRWRTRLEADRVADALRGAAARGVRLLVPGDDDWPAGVADLGQHAPIALWALGPAGFLPTMARSVALVGCRACTDYGANAAADLAAGLVERGFGVVSGAALGIDAAAHRSALASGGRTVAVLAGGLDRFYPRQNERMIAEIARVGAVVSEAPHGTPPDKWRFLRRNRLIAAMSRATVVVEAGRRSGAANTATQAVSLGRPLGAVPGSVNSATSVGCHTLLRDLAAVCVCTAAQAAELAEPVSAAVPLDGLEPPRRGPEQRVLAALAATPRGLDELSDRTGLSPGEVLAALGLLELDDAARECPGGWVLG